MKPYRLYIGGSGKKGLQIFIKDKENLPEVGDIFSFEVSDIKEDPEEPVLILSIRKWGKHDV